MTRSYTVSQIKRIKKGKIPHELQAKPTPGSRIRRIYDVLVSGEKFKCSGDARISDMERTAIDQLRNTYGMDIMACYDSTYLLRVDHVLRT